MLVLREHGRTFATRERARQLAAQVSPGGRVVIDASGATASPSFMAELLTSLVASHSEVVIEGADDHLEALAGSLVMKLGLHQVRIAALA